LKIDVLISIKMPSVQEVYSVASPQVFIEYVKLCRYDIHQKTEYAIIKSTAYSEPSVYPSVKGLIFNTITGDIIAPGAIILKENQDQVIQNYPQPIGFSPALDGVLVRIYRTSEHLVSWSTNGMINPTNGRWGDGKTFGEMFEDVYTQFDHAKIKSDWCYYAIMEHIDYPWITQKTKSRLILISVRDKYGKEVVPMSHLADMGFTYVVDYTDRPPTVNETSFLHEIPARDGPIEAKHIGLVLYYHDQDPLYVISLRAQDACKILPNYPHIWQHWIYCMRKGGLPLVNVYISYFPWSKLEFNRFTSAFMRTTYNLDEITDNKLKTIICGGEPSGEPRFPIPPPNDEDDADADETDEEEEEELPMPPRSPSAAPPPPPNEEHVEIALDDPPTQPPSKLAGGSSCVIS